MLRGLGVGAALSASAATASGTATAASADDGSAGRRSITFDEFVGINAFVDDPGERMAVAGSVREYHNWYWDEGDGGWTATTS